MKTENNLAGPGAVAGRNGLTRVGDLTPWPYRERFRIELHAVDCLAAAEVERFVARRQVDHNVRFQNGHQVHDARHVRGPSRNRPAARWPRQICRSRGLNGTLDIVSTLLEWPGHTARPREQGKTPPVSAECFEVIVAHTGENVLVKIPGLLAEPDQPKAGNA